MKNAVKLLVLFLGVGLMLTTLGCPKKCVKPDEPIPPPPLPEEAPEILDVLEGEGVELNLGAIHFDFDMSDIRTGDAKVLEDNAMQLKSAAEMGLEPMVTIEGHCDPVGTSEYNMALGQRRAEAAKMFLAKMGVPEGQLKCVSFGEEKLVTENEDEYELNRRAEFKPETE